MRDIIDSINILNEGKYGPHGKDLDKAIDAAIGKLGNKPTLDEIYSEVSKITKDKDIGGFLITQGYKRRTALGAIADSLDLPGLYTPQGKSFISVERDDAGRYKGSGAATKQTAQGLAKLGYLQKDVAERLGLENADPSNTSDDDKLAAKASGNLRQVGDDGKVVNFNVNKDLPYIDTKIKGEAVRIHGKEENLNAMMKDRGITAKIQGTGKEEEPKLSPNAKLDDAKAKYKEFMELLNKAKADLKAKKESYKPRSFADQLLEQYFLTEALTDEEADRLQQLADELGAMPEFGDDLDDQIADALNVHATWKKDYEAQFASTPGAEDAGPAVDYSSDEEIKKALDDPENYIANEMPKELEAAGAKGLLKATERGKKKSASAAAVQKIMTQIASITGNKDLDIATDGLYGPGSIAAVKKAQELAGITVDGDPGAQTAGELVKFSKDPTAKGGMADTEVNKDLDTAIALLSKGIEAFGGAKNVEVQSIDYSMRGILETLDRLDEKLSDEDAKQLKAIIAKLQPKLDDGEYQASLDKEMQAKYKQLSDLRKQYNELVSGSAKADAELLKSIPAEIMSGVKGPGTAEDKVYAAVDKIKDKAMFDQILQANPELLTAMLDDFGGTELKLLVQKLKTKGIEVTVDKESTLVSGGSYTYNGKKYGKPAAGGGQMSKNRAVSGKDAVAGGMSMQKTAGVGGQQQDMMTSKDYSGVNALKESASMNISMSGDNAGEVGELLKILKNAGMENAAPVGAVNIPMDTEVPMAGDSKMDIDMDGDYQPDVAIKPTEPQGPMPCPTCGGDHGEDTPCEGGEEWDNSPDEGYSDMMDIIKLSGGPNSNKNPGDIRVKDPRQNDEEVEEDGWDNSPDEEYKDDDYMYQSGGIHRKKKAYAKAQDGDNAMAVESIKDRLYAALAEKNSK